MVLDGKRCLTVITGASRGIGKEIALQVASRSGANSAFLLTARNEATLLEVKLEIKEKCESAQVWIVVCDMGSFNSDAISTFNGVLKEITDQNSFDTALLFHNCGSIGDVSKKSIELSDGDQWRNYLDVNLVSMIQLNNLLLKWVTSEVACTRIVINITSLVAIQAFPSLTQYSVGKAAREGFFRSLACEDASLRVLSYSPGPVDTDMHEQISHQSFDESIRQAFSRDAPSSNINRLTLSTKQTVTKLIQYLEDNNYISGVRIDYFDDEK